MTNPAATMSDFWAPHRRLTLAQARKRSDLVKLLRLLFTAGAAIAAGTLIGHLIHNAITGAGASRITTAESVTMMNPRFTGRDEEGAPYLITAASAQRQRTNAMLVDLVEPSLEDGFSGTVRAPTGQFNQELQTLELYDNVVVTDASGNRFVTTHAEVFVRENRVVGLAPLEGEGPIGKLRADTYEVQDNGDRILLKGNVWTEIVPD